MNLTILFLTVTTMYHLPSNLLSKVCFVESSHKTNIITQDTNGQKSIGICQIQLRTAKSLGFKGSELDLLNPSVNIKFAGAYLSHQFNRYRNWTKAVKAYNAGFAKNNIPNQYYKKVCSVDMGSKIPRLLVSSK